MTAPPEGWRMVKLADVADTALGKMLDAARPKGDLRVPYLRNINVQWGRVDLEDVLEVPLSPGERERFSLTAGDLLVCEGGEIGRAAIWTGGPACMAYQKALHRVRSRGELDLRYLRYLLEHYADTGALAARATGSTIQHLPQRQLRELPIPLPPLDEQRRIVEILEDDLSRLDAALGDVSAARARLGVLRGRVLDRALEDADAAGSPESLGSLVRPGRKLAYGVLVPGPHVEGGVPLIRVGDLRGGVVRQSELKRIAPEISGKFPRTLLEGDEVLLSLVGTIGRTGIAPRELAKANVARAVGVLPLRDGVDARFISLVLEAPRSNRALNGLAHEVARKTLNLEDVNRFEVPVPSIQEQRRIVASADEALSAVQRLEAASDATSSRACGLRRAILGAAFSGRLA